MCMLSRFFRSARGAQLCNAQQKKTKYNRQRRCGIPIVRPATTVRFSYVYSVE